MPLETVDTTLVSSYRVTPRVRQFVLRAEGHTFDFNPGQHVSIVAEPIGGDRVHRPYSPTNQPGTDTIVLAVKRYPDGTGSEWMHDRTPGDSITITPPTGNLQVHDLDRDAVFLATGTGLTPMFSMAFQYLHDGTGTATLVFGERTQEDLMFRQTFDLFAASHPHFSVEYVLSDEDWSGRTGYVQDHLLSVVDDFDAPHFYICGVPEMVVQTKVGLRDAGAPDGHVFSEGWEEGAVEE